MEKQAGKNHNVGLNKQLPIFCAIMATVLLNISRNDPGTAYRGMLFLRLLSSFVTYIGSEVEIGVLVTNFFEKLSQMQERAR